MHNTTAEQQTQPAVTVATGVRVPEKLWKRVRKTALELDTTAQQIVTDALEAHLPRLEKKAR